MKTLLISLCLLGTQTVVAQDLEAIKRRLDEAVKTGKSAEEAMGTPRFDYYIALKEKEWLSVEETSSIDPSVPISRQPEPRLHIVFLEFGDPISRKFSLSSDFWGVDGNKYMIMVFGKYTAGALQAEKDGYFMECEIAKLAIHKNGKKHLDKENDGSWSNFSVHFRRKTDHFLGTRKRMDEKDIKDHGMFYAFINTKGKGIGGWKSGEKETREFKKQKKR